MSITIALYVRYMQACTYECLFAVVFVFDKSNNEKLDT